MNSDLAAACSELGGWLAIAETLLAQADQQPSARSGGKPGSRPPWNPAVANALMDAHEGLRRLEAEMRLEVTGREAKRSSRSGNTGEVLDSIKAMELAVGQSRCGEAIRLLTRWALAIRQLPSVDDAPVWEKIRAAGGGLPPKCPFCGTFSLRVALASGVVACFFPDCTDSTGRRPQARLDLSRINGEPVLVWRTGEVQ